jgi:hypothetical protein
VASSGSKRTRWVTQTGPLASQTTTPSGSSRNRTRWAEGVRLLARLRRSPVSWLLAGWPSAPAEVISTRTPSWNRLGCSSLARQTVQLDRTRRKRRERCLAWPALAPAKCAGAGRSSFPSAGEPPADAASPLVRGS